MYRIFEYCLSMFHGNWPEVLCMLHFVHKHYVFISHSRVMMNETGRFSFSLFLPSLAEVVCKCLLRVGAERDSTLCEHRIYFCFITKLVDFHPWTVFIVPSMYGLSLTCQVSFHRLCLGLNHGEKAGSLRADRWWNRACSPGGSARLQPSKERGRTIKVRRFYCLPGYSEPCVDRWNRFPENVPCC